MITAEFFFAVCLEKTFASRQNFLNAVTLNLASNILIKQTPGLFTDKYSVIGFRHYSLLDNDTDVSALLCSSGC